MEILVVPKEKVEQENLLKAEDSEVVFNFINKYSIHKDRDSVEEDPNFLQIIPYILVFRDGEIFIYQRLKKGNESRLHGKYSAGIGGHVDTPRETTMSGKELTMYNAHKELYEELNIELDGKYVDLKNTGHLIYDPSNPVGEVHLGLLFTCDLSGKEVSVREKDKIEGKFYTVDGLKALYWDKKLESFENWTNIALIQIGLI